MPVRAQLLKGLVGINHLLHDKERKAGGSQETLRQMGRKISKLKQRQKQRVGEAWQVEDPGQAHQGSSSALHKVKYLES